MVGLIGLKARRESLPLPSPGLPEEGEGWWRSLAIFLLLVLAVVSRSAAAAPANVEQWGIFEVSFVGPSDGNPFVDVELSARFSSQNSSVNVHGFYDGDGVYRIRFMPPSEGTWRFETRSNRAELAGKSGEFSCVKPSGLNHGLVRVANTFHFAYADGKPFVPIGTTCYAWAHQPEVMEEKTLETLKDSPFNKVRMCLLPSHYTPGKDDPLFFPFLGTPPKDLDFTKFNVEFFRHLEKRIGNLRDLGIEADLILFHPYDKGQMGLDAMGAANDDRYVRYAVARLSAYRNVWWSMANEFDLIKKKSDADWDRLFQIVRADDPYGHLRSIHNSQRFYDPSKPWVTHVSVQNASAVEDFGRAVLYRDECRKPVVYDEVHYEGHLDRRWGQLSGEEMVHRFWQGMIGGTYVGHGEVLDQPSGGSWTSVGGILVGESPSRIAFLRKVMEQGPTEGIEPIDRFYETHIGGKAGEYYLYYLGKEKPTEWLFSLPKDGLKAGMQFKVEILDTWKMTVTPVDQIFSIVKHSNYLFQAEGDQKVALPGQPYIALRIRRVGGPKPSDSINLGAQ
jgi:Domain of unknown function (DUF5060)/Domain of unknown function (DUF5605)/Protein of unknown function (DUF4038)